MSRKLFVSAATVTSLIVGGFGCAVQPSATPIQIPAPTNPSNATGADAGGSARVYFVGPQEDLLRSVPRSSTSTVELINVLLRGPNEEEQGDNYFTAIPEGTTVNSVGAVGTVLLIDLSEEITNLSGASLQRALAQIVFTATDQDLIEGVRITVEGESVEWPGIPGKDPTLLVYDFPDIVESSQLDYPALPVGPEQ